MSESSPTNQTAGTLPGTRYDEGPGWNDLAGLISPVHPDDPSDGLSGNPIVAAVMRRYATDDIFDDGPQIDLSQTDPDFFITDDKKTAVTSKKANKETLIWDRADDYFVTGNHTGVYTPGSRTLPIYSRIKMNLSDGDVHPDLSVQGLNTLQTPSKCRPRPRTSLTGVFDKPEDGIVSQNDYADLDHVLAVPDVPTDLPVHCSRIKDTGEHTTSVASKKMAFRQVSSNTHLPGKNSGDSVENNIKNTRVSNIKLKEVATLKLASKKAVGKIVSLLHHRIENCRPENAIKLSDAIHPFTLNLGRNNGSQKVHIGKSTLSMVHKMLHENPPMRHPRLDLIRNMTTAHILGCIHPSNLDPRRRNGPIKVIIGKSTLSAIHKILHENAPISHPRLALVRKDTPVARTDATYTRILVLRHKYGPQKDVDRKSPLSTVHKILSETAPVVHARVELIGQESPLGVTGTILPSHLRPHGQNRLAKFRMKGTPLSTVAIPINTTKSVYLKDIQIERTHSIHQSKLKLRGSVGPNKVSFRKSPLSTVELNVDATMNVESINMARSRLLRLVSMKCPIRCTDSVHPSMLTGLRPSVNQASGLALVHSA